MSSDADLLAALEDTFAEALATAIARDAAAHPPTGALTRAILRWHTQDDPMYFTLHLLGADETESATGDEAWTPLEWENVDREIERTDRIRAAPGLNEASAELARIYRERIEREIAAEEAGETVPEQPGGDVSRAIWEAVRRLRPALEREGVPIASEFAATATHFEAYGGLDVLRDTADPAVVSALEARDELPWE